MKTAIFLYADINTIKLEEYITRNFTEILSNEPFIREYACNQKYQYNETDLGADEMINNADYVIIFSHRNANKLSSLTSKCLKYKKSFEVVLI